MYKYLSEISTGELHAFFLLIWIRVFRDMQQFQKKKPPLKTPKGVVWEEQEER